MSSKELIDLAVNGVSGVNRGKAMHLSNRLRSPAEARTNGDSTYRRAFLAEMLDQPKETYTAYDHPENGIHGVDRNKTELRASDLAWLERLPRDPAAVSVDDARTLCGLLMSLPLGKADASDRRLVESHWEPIKHLHDRRKADHDLKQASRPLPSMPPHALSAIAEAIRTENPGMQEEVSLVHARQALAEAQETRAADRSRQITWAQRDLDAIHA